MLHMLDKHGKRSVPNSKNQQAHIKAINFGGRQHPRHRPKMKQNLYDNTEFFQGYKKLRDDNYSLNRVLEEPVMRSLMPDLAGLTVLDIGCGFGSYCKYYADKGAKSIVGIDISMKMLALAKQHNADPRIHYVNQAIEDADFENNSFHLVTSSLALHYVEHYDQLIGNIHAWLKPGGKLVFSVEHPIFTSPLEQKWIANDAGDFSQWVVDSYGVEGIRQTAWLVDNVVKYHRTVSTYLNVLLKKSFRILHFAEPVLNDSVVRERPEFNQWKQVPPFLFLAAEKTV